MWLPLHGAETELPASASYGGTLNDFLPLLPANATTPTAATIVAFDFEATGGSVHTDKAIQLAAKTAALDVSLDPQSDPVVAATVELLVWTLEYTLRVFWKQ